MPRCHTATDHPDSPCVPVMGGNILFRSPSIAEKIWRQSLSPDNVNSLSKFSTSFWEGLILFDLLPKKHIVNVITAHIRD